MYMNDPPICIHPYKDLNKIVEEIRKEEEKRKKTVSEPKSSYKIELQVSGKVVKAVSLDSVYAAGEKAKDFKAAAELLYPDEDWLVKSYSSEVLYKYVAPVRTGD